MSEIKIGIVVGSLRRESFNRKLAGALIKLAPGHFKFKYLRIDDLPLYNEDDDPAPPASAIRLKQEIRDSDALLFVTPEYNRSIPGVLKNALDHASRPYGQSAWAGKPAGMLGISVGPLGTAVAQMHLRTIAAYLDMPTLGQPEIYLTMKDDLFDSSGAVGGEKRSVLQKWVERYVAWVEQHVQEQAAA